MNNKCCVIEDLGNGVYIFSCNEKKYRENLLIAKEKIFEIGEIFEMDDLELEMSTEI